MAEGRSPIVYFMAVTLLIMGVAGAFLAWDNHTKDQEKKRIAAEELAAADQARAQQIREESQKQREAAVSQQTQRNQVALQHALRQIASNSPMAQCDGALALGRMRARDNRPLLETLLESARSNSVKNCAASALVDIGETATALNAYERWARGSEADLKRSALVGFGKIGPDAARAGLPYLTEALKSPHMDERYIAVDALANMGPAAIPLLQIASGDADQRVRARAALALKQRLP